MRSESDLIYAKWSSTYRSWLLPALVSGLWLILAYILRARVQFDLFYTLALSGRVP